MKEIRRALVWTATILFLASYGVTQAVGFSPHPVPPNGSSDWGACGPSPAEELRAGAMEKETVGTSPVQRDRPLHPVRVTVPSRLIVAQRTETREKSGDNSQPKPFAAQKVWKSRELGLLGIGLSVGDLDGDGKSEVVIIGPNTVHAYRFVAGNLNRLAEYSAGSMELKSVDVARMRKQGPCRIYVTAQNRGSVSSFVLEYRNGRLVPVIEGLDYFLRVIIYPTQGPFLLGQKKGLVKMYEGPVYRLADKGDALEPQGRFGIPLKIPIFGFAIGDYDGNYKPLIAVYDKSDHLRIYRPSGKRLYISQTYYGGSDVILRRGGPESRAGSDSSMLFGESEIQFFRPRIMSLKLDRDPKYVILAISHSSKTGRLLGRTKMLEDGRVNGLLWNGDALVRQWRTPRIQGMITDFAVDTLPGLPGRRLITLERMKTDWLSFLKSQSRVRAYDLEALMHKTGGQDEDVDEESD